MGGKKRAKQFFQKHKESACKKFWEKNLREKVRKTFFYSHEYRDQKMGEQNARNNFSRNTLLVQAKMFGKKSSEKSAKNYFILTRIS